jgi:hypothetical protein
MGHVYWAEAVRDGELQVVCRNGSFRDALKSGKACQFYCMDYPTLKQRMAAEYPEADVWYTERNGDPIGMLVPKGTPPELLPSVAMDYIAFEWIDPDKDFGTGVVPVKRQGKT